MVVTALLRGRDMVVRMGGFIHARILHSFERKDERSEYYSYSHNAARCFAPSNTTNTHVRRSQFSVSDPTLFLKF